MIHNQLSAPEFRNLIQDGFIKAKIIDETIGEIKKPNDVRFQCHDLYCSNGRCIDRTLMTCAWCKNLFAIIISLKTFIVIYEINH